MDLDPKLKNYLLVSGGVILIALIIWAAIPSGEIEVLTEIEPVKKEVIEEIIETKKDIVEKKPEYKVDLNLQSEFNTLVSSINEDVKKCQQGIAKLFPNNDPDNRLPYQTAAEIKTALDNFYGLVNEKIINTHRVIGFFDEKNYEALDPKQTFEKLAQIEDCGDFEEESVVDSIISYISDYNFTAAEKKSIVSNILNHFQGQLKVPVGLHHIMSKVESLESLLEENLIPGHYQEDIARVNQILEDSEEDFRRILPTNLGEKKFLSPKEIIDIKDRENEILDRVKSTLGDILTQIEEGR